MVKKIKNVSLDGYEDLFDEEGADPKELKFRAETKIHHLNETEDYAKYLVKQRVKWDKDDLGRLNEVIDELKSILSERESPKLKELLSEKVRERKITKKNIKAQQKMLKIMNETLREKMSSHKQVLEQVSAKCERKVIRNFNKQPTYIG